MSLYTQNVGWMRGWLNGWLKVNESQKRELWIKSAVAEETCVLIYNEIFCANYKLASGHLFCVQILYFEW